MYKKLIKFGLMNADFRSNQVLPFPFLPPRPWSRHLPGNKQITNIIILGTNLVLGMKPNMVLQ